MLNLELDPAMATSRNYIFKLWRTIVLCQPARTYWERKALCGTTKWWFQIWEEMGLKKINKFRSRSPQELWKEKKVQTCQELDQLFKTLCMADCIELGESSLAWCIVRWDQAPRLHPGSSLKALAGCSYVCQCNFCMDLTVLSMAQTMSMEHSSLWHIFLCNSKKRTRQAKSISKFCAQEKKSAHKFGTSRSTMENY